MAREGALEYLQAIDDLILFMKSSSYVNGEPFAFRSARMKLLLDTAEAERNYVSVDLGYNTIEHEDEEE